MTASPGIAWAASNPAIAQLLKACDSRTLTPWEVEFVQSIRERRKAVTDKQRAILTRIAEGPPDYALINAAALHRLVDLLQRWLPDGETRGHEYAALNPKRSDNSIGSFSINLVNGRWADFSSGDSGGDPISLAAYLFDLQQPEAARRVAGQLGLASGNASP